MKDQLLCFLHPDIWEEAIRYPAGLSVLILPGDIYPTLLVKLQHQYLLTARIQKGFKIYVAPIQLPNLSTISLVSAFMDDEDSPLVVRTSVGPDRHSQDLLNALRLGKVYVRMIDEHNREILGYRATVDIPLKTRIMMDVSKFYETNHDLEHAMSESAMTWFSTRTSKDDAEAIAVKLDTPIYDEDRKFTDERPDLFKFHGFNGFTEVSLVKLEPGQFQEMDILLLLQRIFSADQIYYSPRRINDGEEICDILVITEQFCLVVQAKDSPNTEEMLLSTLERKRRKAKKQLKEGCKQVAGAIGYFCRVQPLSFVTNRISSEIDLGHREIFSLVVIRERFDDDFYDYSSSLMSLHRKIDFPVLGVGYDELIQICTYCQGPEGFREAYMQLFNEALRTGIFKRMRFGIRDLFDSNDSFIFK